MDTLRRTAGFTLIEVIVSLLVFTVGALALAASSALIAQAMGTNALRERGDRIAANRMALIKSQCSAAISGSEKLRQIESAWSVTRVDRTRITVTESVSYTSPHGDRIQTYRATLLCRE